MDPYDVLGCSPSTPMEEIETAYRLLLRKHHPDLHHAEGPAAVATAERTTRTLNLAITEIRTGRHGPRQQPSYPPHDRGRRGGGFGGYEYTGPDQWRTSRQQETGGSRDEQSHWMGEPITHDPDEPVPCPYCQESFYELDDFRAHMAERHHFHNAAERVPRDRPPPKPVAVLGKLRFVPSSLVTVIVLFLVIVHAPPWLWISGMVFLCAVLWAQTSKAVRRRNRR